MNYLVIKNKTITQICTSIEELLDYLKVTVTDKGFIEVSGKNMNFCPSYNMNEFTKEEVIKDFMKYYLKKLECVLKIGIYKLERI